MEEHWRDASGTAGLTPYQQRAAYLPGVCLNRTPEFFQPSEHLARAGVGGAGVEMGGGLMAEGGDDRGGLPSGELDVEVRADAAGEVDPNAVPVALLARAAAGRAVGVAMRVGDGAGLADVGPALAGNADLAMAVLPLVVAAGLDRGG